MAYSSTQVSVGTSRPALLFQTSTGIAPDPKTTSQGGPAQVFSARAMGNAVTFHVVNNDATNAVYVGGPTVSTASGIKLAPGGALDFTVSGNNALYAIGTAGAAQPVIVGILASTEG